ncbi:Conserved_hypothetical protein [Hexamita inflata]|uniref:Uncharacterized protein n=1 Tax=Hexamita inflata TaxID=28002 RepID=A0AA86R3L5_9EUKA|nr:Conserved hypothetical protein [Hexamita inflata]
MNDSLKLMFGNVFINFVSLKTGIECKDIFQAHQVFLLKQDGAKFDIWKNMSYALNIPSKKVHDYYHNTWSKQFYDDIDPYRIQIQKLVHNSKIQESMQDIVRNVISQLKQLYPKITLHFQTVYQFVNYQVKNRNKLNDQLVSKNEVQSSQKETVSETVQILKQSLEALEQDSKPAFMDIYDGEYTKDCTCHQQTQVSETNSISFNEQMQLLNIDQLLDFDSL